MKRSPGCECCGGEFTCATDPCEYWDESTSILNLPDAVVTISGMVTTGGFGCSGVCTDLEGDYQIACGDTLNTSFITECGFLDNEITLQIIHDGITNNALAKISVTITSFYSTSTWSRGRQFAIGTGVCEGLFTIQTKSLTPASYTTGTGGSAPPCDPTSATITAVYL